MSAKSIIFALLIIMVLASTLVEYLFQKISVNPIIFISAVLVIIGYTIYQAWKDE